MLPKQYEYSYYPLPTVLLQECKLPRVKPTTGAELLVYARRMRVCAEQGNDDKAAIKAILKQESEGEKNQ